MIRLRCKTQQYAWGKIGPNSSVARLNQLSDPCFDPDSETPYAELWMGTHPNGPATIFNKSDENGGEVSLLDYIAEKPDMVGIVPPDSKIEDLPFMFKVLSIRKALSIQAHPDKDLAKRLHASQPQHYKDPNHKPEMAIALTEFEAMCGFRPVSEIINHIATYPEFADIVGTVDPHQGDASYLKAVFSNFMRASNDKVQRSLTSLIDRLNASELNEGIDSLILRLSRDFPGDRGALCPLILNYITLNPGDAFFMGPNGPHAYLSGDIIECMALSDNTVRAGLSPKHKDVETLVEMLEYVGRDASCQFMVPIERNAFTRIYRPPADICSEFEVEKTELPRECEYSPESLNCCCLILIVSGECSVAQESGSELFVAEGHVYFLAARTAITVKTSTSGVKYYCAHINLQNL